MQIVIYTEAGSDAPDQGKFVQLRIADQEVLLFAPKSIHEWHNQIVRHYLDELGIANQWFNPDRLKIDEDHVDVIGGGHFVLDVVAKTLRLFGESQAYGRFDANGLVERIQEADHGLSGYRTLIE